MYQGRRSFLLLSGFMLAGCVAGQREPDLSPVEDSYAGEPFPVKRVKRSRFADEYQPQRLAMPSDEKPGTIIVDTQRRQLSFVQDNNRVLRYGIAVGASGHAWKGRAKVGRKARWPAWYPTDDMHAQTPGLPRRIEPGPANPLGARALYLYQGGVDTLYRIHGTSEPWTIGTEASSGCIRMLNEDIIDLYDLVSAGADVIVR